MNSATNSISSRPTMIWHPSTGRFRAARRWSTTRTLGLSFDNLEAATHLCVQCLNQLLPKKKVAATRS